MIESHRIEEARLTIYDVPKVVNDHVCVVCLLEPIYCSCLGQRQSIQITQGLYPNLSDLNSQIQFKQTTSMQAPKLFQKQIPWWQKPGQWVDTTYEYNERVKNQAKKLKSENKESTQKVVMCQTYTQAVVFLIATLCHSKANTAKLTKANRKTSKLIKCLKNQNKVIGFAGWINRGLDRSNLELRFDQNRQYDENQENVELGSSHINFQIKGQQNWGFYYPQNDETIQKLSALAQRAQNTMGPHKGGNDYKSEQIENREVQQILFGMLGLMTEQEKQEARKITSLKDVQTWNNLIELDQKTINQLMKLAQIKVQK